MKFDMEKLKKDVKEHHNAFVEKYSGEITKASEDHLLRLSLVKSKLKAIGYVLHDVGIIEDIQQQDNNNPYIDKYAVRQKNFPAQLFILTDGNSVVVKDSHDGIHDPLGSDYIFYEREVCNEDYNWNDFGKKLVGSIHNVIYKRTEAIELFMSEPREKF